MNQLDSLSAQIISDLDDNIASSEVIEALIGNYRLRIELLEDMLRIMKEEGTEKEKKQGNEL
jgi:predicted CopG family antitoxin